MSAKGSKKLTEKEFGQVKVLQGYGLKPKQVAELVKRAYGTVSVLYKFETFADYQTYNRERLNKPKQAAEPESTLMSHEDIKLLLERLDEVKCSVDLLVEDLEKRQANEKANSWKFGRSR